MANPGDWLLCLGRQLASRVNTIGRRFVSVIRHLEAGFGRRLLTQVQQILCFQISSGSLLG
jgi:hypothetical protein